MKKYNARFVKIIATVLIFVSLIFMVSCSSIPASKSCNSDNDCVAATCCHSTDSVNLDNAPDCQGVVCTASCEEGTMDCGQAKARCIEEACTVVAVE